MTWSFFRLKILFFLSFITFVLVQIIHTTSMYRSCITANHISNDLPVTDDWCLTVLNKKRLWKNTVRALVRSFFYCLIIIQNRTSQKKIYSYMYWKALFFLDQNNKTIWKKDEKKWTENISWIITQLKEKTWRQSGNKKKLNICLICSVCTLLTNKIRCKYVINCDIFRLQRQRTTN